MVSRCNIEDIDITPGVVDVTLEYTQNILEILLYYIPFGPILQHHVTSIISASTEGMKISKILG
jgi:hypothetical protein